MSYDPSTAKSIFLRALELSSAAERSAFVQQSCAGQPDLQVRVESLLKTALAPDSLLDKPIVELDATQMVDAAPFVSLDFLEPSDVPGSLGRLNGYTVLEVIGRGGMGIVLRAVDPKLNRVVAIKVLAPEYAGNPQARRRFLREAQAAAAVSHDHVVTIFAVGDSEKLPFLVMECIVGQSLQQKIDTVGALSVTEILRIGMQIAAGLSAAHKQGLVHRDIKPANILLENGVERVKITDFGLARSIDDVGITVTGQIAGTPQYMSPEQAMGQPVDQRSDLFSLGSVLYTLCTGRPAFRGDSAIAVLRRVCDDRPRPIAELNTEIPDWLITIVDRLMAKRPEDRLQTANEVHELLQQWLAYCQQPASAPRPTPLTPVGILNLQESPKNSQPQRNWSRVWLALAAILIVAVPILMSTWFQLWSHNMAGLNFETRDGNTAVEIIGSAGVVARQTGWGRVVIPAGHYGLRVEPKPGLRVDEVHLERNSMWPWQRTIVKLTSAPQTFPVTAGERWSIWVTFVKSDESLGFPESLTAVAEVASDNSDWKPLFNGRDLQGWKKQEGPAVGWHVQEGNLTGRGACSPLFVDATTFGDFHLKAEVRFNRRGNCGIAFRTLSDAAMSHATRLPGYKATIHEAGPSQNLSTGALVGVYLDRMTQQPSQLPVDSVTPDEWMTFQIIAKSNHIIVKVNGFTTIDYTDPDRSLVSGYIALRNDSPDSIVQFRQILIREEVPETSLPPMANAPFSATQARQHQDAWASRLNIPVDETNSLGMPLKLIPPGKFLMGSSDNERATLAKELEQASAYDKFVAQSSAPQHPVELTKPFYIGQHEVTVAQFQKFVETTKYETSAERATNSRFTWKKFVPESNLETQPVCGISWEDAKAFCEWLSESESTEDKKLHYDLPTEAQWEFACRAGQLSAWSFGDFAGRSSEFGYMALQSPVPQNVGQRRPNAFGLYDMHGNVSEWCLDWHNLQFYAVSPLKDPVFNTDPKDASSGRVVRGGSWNAAVWWSRSATRAYDSPTLPVFPTGFRVVRTVPEAASGAEAK